MDKKPGLTPEEIAELDALDLDGIEIKQPPPKQPPPPRPRGSGQFATPGLKKFLAKHARDFEATGFMLYHEPEGARREQTADKTDFKCPFEDELHSNPKPDDTGFFVENASARDSGFMMHCMHDTCIATTDRDRARYLDKACQNYGVKHADELLEFCPNAPQEPPRNRESSSSSNSDGASTGSGSSGGNSGNSDGGDCSGAAADFNCDSNGTPYKSAHNVRVGLRKLDVLVRYDTFANIERIRGLKDFADDSELDDHALVRLWIDIDEQFRFKPAWDFFCKAVEDSAYLNRYNPVDEYMTGLQWDGTPRIDSWLIDYMGAEDTPLNRAIGQLWLIAAARRARKPGTKFDQMLVFEDMEGTGKSTAFGILAVKEEWFTDQVPLTASYKDVQELLAGIWIAEMGELAGLRKADVEPVKVFLARRFDRGRGAYKRKTKSQGRTCVFGGSTNDAKYLKSTTGNRSFWPVRTGCIDLAGLKRDVDKLWAEAAKLEAEGTSIVLDEKLWSAAAKEQQERRTENPFVDKLAELFGGFEGGIRSIDVWNLLNIPPDRQHPHVIEQVSDAMRQLGWGLKKGIKWGGGVRQGYRKGKSQDLKACRRIDGTWELEVLDVGDGNGGAPGGLWDLATRGGSR